MEALWSKNEKPFPNSYYRKSRPNVREFIIIIIISTPRLAAHRPVGPLVRLVSWGDIEVTICTAYYAAAPTQFVLYTRKRRNANPRSFSHRIGRDTPDPNVTSPIYVVVSDFIHSGVVFERIRRLMLAVVCNNSHLT